MVSSPQWRGQRDTSGLKRLWKLLAVSVLLHVPLTPIAALLGLLALIGRPSTPELPPEPPVNAIPVDLVEGEAPAKPVEAPPKEEAPAKEPPPETEEPEAEADKPAPKEKEPEQKPERVEGMGSGIGDPVTMAGSAAKVADANANVRLLIFADRIRNHPLGTRIGELLGAADQWQDFFGPGGIDPIKDVDRIMLAGPQLRNSENVVAVLRHSAGQTKMRAAIDSLVKRDPQGKWLDGPVPAAHARADRAERVFVIASPRIVVVTPPSAAQHAIKVGPSLRFPEAKGSEALTTFVVTPWRAFIGIPYDIPHSIKWVKMRIIPTPDGGAIAEIEAKDESAETAKQNAEALTRDINKLTQVNTGAIGAIFGVGTYKVIEPVSFSANGDTIVGTVKATPRQLGTLLEMISKIAKDIAKKNAEKAKAKAAAAAAADGGAPVSVDAGIKPPQGPKQPAPPTQETPNPPSNSTGDNPYGD